MTAPADRPPIAAAVIVYRGHVLLVQRRHAEGSLSWQLPAGEVEPGETPAQAAVRETLEETGLDVADMVTLGERVHPATGRRMVYVECSVVAGEARIADPDELAAVEWATRDRLADLVPGGFHTPVQVYLDVALASGTSPGVC